MSVEVLDSRTFGRANISSGSNISFFELPVAEQLRLAAWYHACPQPTSVVREYGEEWTLQRYISCNIWFQFGFVAEAREENPALYEQLTRPVSRAEPVGIFEAGAVPNSHERELSPLSTPWGYALPRVLIEQFGGNKPWTQERMVRGLEIVSQVIPKAKNPIELLAMLAEAVVKADADPDAVLSHILSPGVLEEENCRIMFQGIFHALKQKSPTLWQRYEELSPEELKEKDIINVANLQVSLD